MHSSEYQMSGDEDGMHEWPPVFHGITHLAIEFWGSRENIQAVTACNNSSETFRSQLGLAINGK